jgi:hypothetical protein
MKHKGIITRFFIHFQKNIGKFYIILKGNGNENDFASADEAKGLSDRPLETFGGIPLL